jgi:hypothetical protein
MIEDEYGEEYSATTAELYEVAAMEQAKATTTVTAAIRFQVLFICRHRLVY